MSASICQTRPFGARSQRGGTAGLAAIVSVSAILSILVLRAPDALANAAERPLLQVVIQGNPTVEGALSVGEFTCSGTVTHRATETVLSFARWDCPGGKTPPAAPSTLAVTVDGVAHQIPGPQAPLYNDIYTLDLGTWRLLPGTTVGRDAMLVGSRLGVTLLVEGLVFLLLGFRTRRSWLLFLTTNVVTQGAVNLELSVGRVVGAYGELGYTVMEILVLGVELALLVPLIREKTKKRVALTVFLANVGSLAAGLFLLSAVAL